MSQKKFLLYACLICAAVAPRAWAGNPPSITAQPQNEEVAAGTNVSFTVGASGTAPFSFQWYYDGQALADTNSVLTLTNVQPTNAGYYCVLVSNSFGFQFSTVATLAVDSVPIIVSQPQSETVAVGSNVTFTVAIQGADVVLPPVGSGTLELWLEADAGVITNAGGSVGEWDDQSGNGYSALQDIIPRQPSLVAAGGLGGRAAVRFDGVQPGPYGSFMYGEGQMNVPNAMTAFTVYDAFSTTNTVSTIWDLGDPTQVGMNRGAMIVNGDLNFTFWGYDFNAPFVVPTNTYRIRTDRLDTNLDTLDMIDDTLSSETNFSLPVSGASYFYGSYYLGGVSAVFGDRSGQKFRRGHSGVDLLQWLSKRARSLNSDRLLGAKIF